MRGVVAIEVEMIGGPGAAEANDVPLYVVSGYPGAAAEVYLHRADGRWHTLFPPARQAPPEPGWPSITAVVECAFPDARR